MCAVPAHYWHFISPEPLPQIAKWQVSRSRSLVIFKTLGVEGRTRRLWISLDRVAANSFQSWVASSLCFILMNTNIDLTWCSDRDHMMWWIVFHEIFIVVEPNNGFSMGLLSGNNWFETVAQHPSHFTGYNWYTVHSADTTCLCRPLMYKLIIHPTGRDDRVYPQRPISLQWGYKSVIAFQITDKLAVCSTCYWECLHY